MSQDQKKTKPKKAKIPNSIRKNVWLKYMGKNYEGLCLCCSIRIITIHGYECGHVVSEAKGGDMTIANLRPICSECNRSMMTTNMVSFMKLNEYKKPSNWDGHNNGSSSILANCCIVM